MKNKTSFLFVQKILNIKNVGSVFTLINFRYRVSCSEIAKVGKHRKRFTKMQDLYLSIDLYPVIGENTLRKIQGS